MSLLRPLFFALLATSTTGCLQYILVMGNHSQVAAAYKKVIGDAVGDAREKNDCPRWIAGINSIREKLPAQGSQGNPTYYGSEIEDAFHTCAGEALQQLEKGEGDERARLAAGVERFTLVLSMPLQDLRLQDTKRANGTVRPGKESLAKLKGSLEQRIAELDRLRAEALARQQRRIDAAKLAEARGWPLAALASWLSVQPLDKDVQAEKEAALTKLAPLAHAQVAVPVALAPADTDPAPPEVLALVRAAGALTGPTLRLVERTENPLVQVHLSVGKTTREAVTERLSFEHRYVSGSTMVPNPALEELRKDIARFDKEADWNQKGAEAACRGQKGPCKLREMRLNEAQSYREKSRRAREKLAHEKPTVRKDVTAVYPYDATKQVWTVGAPISLVMSAPARQPTTRSGTAKVQRAATSWAGNEKVGLASREDPQPTPQELDEALRAECARLLAEAAASAPALVADELDAKAAAATEPLEKLHLGLIRALRSRAAADLDPVNALATSLLQSRVELRALEQALRPAALQAQR
ncbi:MAG: hypothetical protein ACOZQL_20000 [Myxococcota bacterium]